MSYLLFYPGILGLRLYAEPEGAVAYADRYRLTEPMIVWLDSNDPRDVVAAALALERALLEAPDARTESAAAAGGGP